MRLNIPVGVSDFAEIRQNGYYYVDKTELISELLKTTGTKVTLITRPRRFGKTLGMSMLAHFFDISEKSESLFDGLEAAAHREMCAAWMNQWPTVFLSFKNVDGLSFAQAYGQLEYEIADLYGRFEFLTKSSKISAEEKGIFNRIKQREASSVEICRSIQLLLRMLEKYYGKQVILLLDEYDVPLAKASLGGYYEEMLEIIRSMMSTSLKDNTSLKLAVITGCLKIAKESIFTGTNNFVSDTISSTRLNEYFGFTPTDVDRILADSGMQRHADTIRGWYDGYRFGEVDVYCPWDVMNYIHDLQLNPDSRPVGYWKNTSDNAIIRSFIDYAGSSITRKFETLLQGDCIIQRIEENLTYDFLHSSEENLWSILYLTGYLTKDRNCGKNRSCQEGETALVIPNEEIREIFQTTIIQWFGDHAKSWNRKRLFEAVWSGDSTVITEEMNTLLRKTISYHDYREDFYHAFLAGIFAGAGFVTESNREHGEGRSDVVLYDTSNGRAAVFEVKYSTALEKLQGDCEKALKQMNEKQYAKDLEDDYDQVLCYGISFYKKRCIVKRK